MILHHAIPVMPETTLNERVVAVTLVLLLHVAVALFLLMQPEQARIHLNEMSVSIAMQQAEEVVQPRAQAAPPPKIRPRIERRVMSAPERVVPKSAEAEAPAPVISATAPSAEAAVASTAPVADSEPDYQARYLNNPRPDYPMVARRMGWQGRVILNVEVLAEGSCGAINVLRSSGHEVLDNAALNTVKGWHFVPARHAGRAITQWFKVPINFSLEDNEA